MSQPSLQLSLPLFSRNFDELIQTKGIDCLSVQISRKLKSSWYVKADRFTGKRILTIPSYLENAPDNIKFLMIQWALLPITRRKSSNKIRVALERNIRNFIDTSCDVPPKRIRIDTNSLQKSTRGCTHDLREVFDFVNVKYCDSKVNAFVRWGSPFSVTSYQTTRKAYDGSKIHIITIAGVYDHPDVPRFALESVMYHEMLHIIIPPYKKNGRNVIHGIEFKKAETAFEHYEKWAVWERNCLRDVLRKKKQRRRKLFLF